jgi:hypothetical protein
MKKLLLAAAAALCTATAAHASIIPVLMSVTPEGDLFRYTYQGTLAGDSGITQGSKLVIFDFAGFSGGLQVPSPFVTASTELSSGMFAPGNGDDPNVLNLVFTWNGPDFHTSGGAFPEVQFEGLSALSSLSGVGFDGYSAITIKNNGMATGTVEVNAGTVEVPLFAAVGIPEPTTWGLMILGFGGIGALARGRRRSQPALA